MMKKPKFSSFFGFFLALSGLVVALFLVQAPQRFLSEALGEPANIIVDTASVSGPVWPVWRALAQGGEENANMLAGLEPQIKELRPYYIRLDHVFDFYETVRKENGQLIYDWSGLDAVVDSIIASGSKPFFALSYMPPSVAIDGDITAPPVDWQDWQAMVRSIIEHYSGKKQRNLSEIYYEVWNEPDLFGGWKIGGNRDYRQLYLYAARGALQVRDANRFFLGGPGTTGLYKNWITGLVGYVEKNQLPLDFLSWHHYSKDPSGFSKELNSLDEWLAPFPRGPLFLRFITEWGSDSENAFYHDTLFDAAHLVSVIREILHGVNLAFTFEIKDGKDPGGQEYWGRWGLFTHSLKAKPKYEAMRFLNQMEGARLELSGEGTWVTGFAVKDGEKTKLILANYDPYGKHLEAVPVSFLNLADGDYLFEEKKPYAETVAITETIKNGVFARQVLLRPNEIVLLTLTKSL